jgi:hypothetical protein
MKKVSLLVLLIMIFIIFPSSSSAKDLPKIAVWDLASGDIKAAYAQDLTLILVSEISKLGSYEVYSQENVRTLAGWTEERMKLGCTGTQCLTALGQMDIAKLISGRIGKIGDRYAISLNLFDTQNARSERSVSEFCGSENELIEAVQAAVRKLLGVEVGPSKVEEKAPGKAAPGLPPPLPARSDWVPFAGKWYGRWSNNLGESGDDSLVLKEDQNGNISGVWTNEVSVSGRRINGSTIELQGWTATRSYQMTVTATGNEITMQYTATRLNSSGSYRGTARLFRR